MSEPIREFAHAKINLTLEVLRKRDDGFHEIASIMQTLELHDDVILTESERLSFSCDWPHLETGDNLVVRAARVMAAELGRNDGVGIDLRKRIPEAAGLGGGSSDAAAVLRGLNRLWGAGLSQDRLIELAGRLGSDVPFFLLGGTAQAEGRGERLSPLPDIEPLWVVLVVPAVFLERKTAMAYGSLTPGDFGDGAVTRAMADAIVSDVPIDRAMMFNTFGDIMAARVPEIERVSSLIRAHGEEPLLSGAGPSMFVTFRDRERVEAFHSLLSSLDVQTILTRTCPRGPQA